MKFKLFFNGISSNHNTACDINYHKRISRYDSEADEKFLYALMSFYCESLESEKSLLLAVCSCVDERNYIDKRKLFTLSCLIKKSSHSFPQKHFYDFYFSHSKNFQLFTIESHTQFNWKLRVNSSVYWESFEW